MLLSRQPRELKGQQNSQTAECAVYIHSSITWGKPFKIWPIREVVSCHPYFSEKGRRETRLPWFFSCLSSEFLKWSLQLLSLSLKLKHGAVRHLNHENEHIFGTMINTRMMTFSLLQNKLVTCISAPHQVCKVLLVGDPQESSQFNLVPGCLSLLPTCVWLCAIYC